MKVALLSPIAWRTPPRHYGPWEYMVSLLSEGLQKKGIEVSLFATADSLFSGKLEAICPAPYEENKKIDAKVWECLHIAHLFEQADKFDIIHNNYDFLPLSYSRLCTTPMVTTIHGFSSPKILPVYKSYNDNNYYVSISNSDRCSELSYFRTVYHGIDLNSFSFQPKPENYLLFFGRIHPDKGTWEAIDIAQKSGMNLYIAGIIQDQEYFNTKVKPYLNGKIQYLGPAGPYERNTLLGSAYALLHPISFAEPFGLSVVEAMACGTPVIAFNRGSMPEIIKDNKSGYLVNTVDEAVKSLEDISSLSRYYCRQHVEKHFSRERMVEDYLKVYNDILNNC